MSNSRDRSVVDDTNTDKVRLKQTENLSEKELARTAGIAGQRKFEGFPAFLKLPYEKVTEGQNNSRIVLGRDRPHSRFSGYGGRGDSHCAAIDIVAGAHGHYAKRVDEQGNPILADPNFKADAARIYLSQKTDIDANFGLRLGHIGNARAKSAIALKADNIRIIAREGIKLVTKTDDENSQGGAVKSTTGIAFVAGNDDSDMQPLVKGNELVKYLDNINLSIQELSGIVNHFWSLFLRLETVLATHTHTTSCGMGPGVALPSIELSTVVSANTAEEMSLLFPSQVTNKVNTMLQELNQMIKPLTSGKTMSLDPNHPGWAGRLLSKHNYTN
tara:strand:- start:1651 stop:2640 length:990 start_codon:yes stop_codon:yes gene_type:complete